MERPTILWGNQGVFLILKNNDARVMQLGKSAQKLSHQCFADGAFYPGGPGGPGGPPISNYTFFEGFIYGIIPGIGGL